MDFSGEIDAYEGSIDEALLELEETAERIRSRDVLLDLAQLRQATLERILHRLPDPLARVVDVMDLGQERKDEGKPKGEFGDTMFAWLTTDEQDELYKACHEIKELAGDEPEEDKEVGGG